MLRIRRPWRNPIRRTPLRALRARFARVPSELRSAVHSDARAVDCAMASQGLEICARATPESDFAKVFSEGHMRQSSTESTVA